MTGGLRCARGPFTQKAAKLAMRMDHVLEFFGVDRGVVKDPAYSERWDDEAAERRCFNESCIAPVLGTGLDAPRDDRKLYELVPRRNEKCFIADLRSARQCGYKPNEHAYRVNNPDHSVIKRPR